MLKYECYLFVLAVDFLFKLIVCRFLYVEISFLKILIQKLEDVRYMAMGSFLLCLDMDVFP